MPYYPPSTGYRPLLALDDEICPTISQAQARDKEIIIDRLSGLAPEVIDRMLTHGTTETQEATLLLLLELGRDARYTDAPEPPAVAMAAE